MRQVSPSVYCKVCLLPHDEEIHQATLAVRTWHRGQVTRSLEAIAEVEPAAEAVEFPESRVA